MQSERANVVVLEGLPGAGKTSLITKFNNHESVSVINEVQSHSRTNLHTKDYYLESDRIKYHTAEDARAQGNPVLMDRGILSTIAYYYSFDMTFGTSRLDGVLSDIEAESIFKIDTVQVLLDITPELSRKQKQRKKEGEYIWTYKKFLKWYEYFYSTEFYNYVDKEGLIVINASDRTIDSLFKEIAFKFNEQ